METLRRFCVGKLIDIDQYMLQLITNIAGVRFLSTVYNAVFSCELFLNLLIGGRTRGC